MNPAAVFLDRDGTIIENTGYLSDPADVRLLPGAASAIRELSQAGYRIVLVSNQSGVARGMFDESALARVHSRLESLLKEQGAGLDAHYYCPYLAGAEAKVEAYRQDSELRKPNPGMLLRAAKELRLDLARSWMIGDSESDVEAGRRAGCRTILLGNGAPTCGNGVGATAMAPSLVEAAALIRRRIVEPAPEAAAVPRPKSDRVITVLTSLHALVERMQRQSRQHDFSVLRLVGTLLQMFSIVTAIWGTAALFTDQPSATPRLLLACYFQIAALCAFATDRFR